MKRILALMLIIIMTASCIAGCSGEVPEETTGPAVTETTADETTQPVTEPVTTEEETTQEPETEPVTFEEFVITPDEEAELAVALMFGDLMVLQHDAVITVWGTSNKEGAKIRGMFMDDEARGEVVDGKWEIKFSPKPVTKEPQTMTIDDSCGNTVTFSDVLVGDVWLIGGQSNAEATGNDIPQAYKDVDPNEDRLLRILHQGADDVLNRRAEAKKPREDLINPRRQWTKETKKAAANSTLLGVFLGERLADETGIPIGIICIAANGAKLCELMPSEMCKEFKYTVGGGVGVAEFYNGLIHPFLRIKFKGMVFFQGESEGFTGSNPTPKKYDRDLKAYFTELRSRWGFDFPVYNVQLSDYTIQSAAGSANTGYVRAQQYNAYLNMENTRIIPSYDLGGDDKDPNYMHSPKKKALGDRIANLVLADLYGIGSADDALAPEPVEIKLSDDKTYATVRFKNVGEGLVSKGGEGKFNGFEAGKITKLTAVEAEIISKDTVKVYLPSGSLTGIAYACAPHVAANDVQLYNSNGLPAVAFYMYLD
ncbi:MAG: hypothetical protein J5585_03910 [Clostridia bacterium]|nr:hypothetical protein [Clostridia bacterium]